MTDDPTGDGFIPAGDLADEPPGRTLRFTRASEIEPRPAPWPHFPHCPHCHRRIVAATEKAARLRGLLPFDGTSCPYCHRQVGLSPEQLQRRDDAGLVRAAADLLYPPGDPRAGQWPSAQVLGRMRTRLRSLADWLDQS
jgi:hypothetical protein